MWSNGVLSAAAGAASQPVRSSKDGAMAAGHGDRSVRQIEGPGDAFPDARVAAEGSSRARVLRRVAIRHGRRVAIRHGVDAGRVDQFDVLPDPLGGTWASDGVDGAAIELAESVPAASAVLVDRTQLSSSGEACLLFDPCAAARGPARRHVEAKRKPRRSTQSQTIWSETVRLRSGVDAGCRHPGSEPRLFASTGRRGSRHTRRPARAAAQSTRSNASAVAVPLVAATKPGGS